MKKIVAYSFAIAVGFAGLGAAQAAPLTVPAGSGSHIELVSGGCGQGGHRDGYGRCRPNFRQEVRRCPPGTHPTPGGCRRNY